LGIFGVLLYYVKFQGGLDAVKSEVEMINAVKIILPIYLIVASFFFMVQDYAKIHVVEKDPNWLFFPFWRSFSFVCKNFLKVYPLYLLNVFTFALVFIAFWYFRFSNNMDTVATLALTFALGQTFIFGRIGTKMLNLGSATLMYQSIMQKEREKEREKKRIEEEETQSDALSQNETPIIPLPIQQKEEEEE
jgi:hypothetical protein